MKKLFFLIGIITLPLIVFFQYRQYLHFHPPSDYDYPVSDEIDLNYYEPHLIQDYYDAAAASGNYARYAWKEHRIDVRSEAQDDPESGAIVDRYQKYVNKARILEERLKQSARWKGEGLNNSQIRQREHQLPEGTSQGIDQLIHQFEILAQIQDEGALVYEAQKKLREKGYEIRVDGIFRIETQQAVRAFQEQSGIFPSGKLDRMTFLALVEDGS